MATKKKVISADTISKTKKNSKKGIDVEKVKDIVVDNKDLIADVAEGFLGVDIDGDGDVGGSKKKTTKKKSVKKEEKSTLESVIDLMGTLKK